MPGSQPYSLSGLFAPLYLKLGAIINNFAILQVRQKLTTELKLTYLLSGLSVR